MVGGEKDSLYCLLNQATAVNMACFSLMVSVREMLDIIFSLHFMVLSSLI